MDSSSNLRFYQKQAWVIVFVIWAVHLGLSIRNLVPSWQDICLACMPGGASPMQVTIGMTWNQLLVAAPGFARFLAAILIDDGISGAGFAILGMIITITGFRKAERWAWFASWSLPVGIIAAQLNQFALAGSTIVLILSLVFVAVSLVSILLPYKIFFSKKYSLP